MFVFVTNNINNKENIGINHTKNYKLKWKRN